MSTKATKSGSKNNLSNRGKKAELKHVNGKVVIPVEYKGGHLGHSNYIAAKFEDGSLVLDESGRPLPYRAISFLK